MEHPLVNKSAVVNRANADHQSAVQKKEGAEGAAMQAAGKESTGAAAADSRAAIQDARKENGGNLPDDIQLKMEHAFGVDFSDVKVHQGSSSASDMDALAYTQGNEIHFAPQQDPYSTAGQKILGHELAHVQQQREDRVEATHRENGLNVNSDQGLEREADILGTKAAAGEKINAPTRGNAGAADKTSPSVQKKSNAPIQKYSSLPGGSQIITIEPDLTNVYLACSNLASQIHAGAASNVNWAARIGERVAGPLQANTLPPVTNINFVEDTGLNWNWTVTLNWGINNKTPVGNASDSTVTRNFGGSTQTTNGSGSSTQDSASATAGTGERKSGGEGSVTAGTQSGTTTSNQQQVTLNGGGTSAQTEQQQVYTAEMVASITIQGSPDFSGTDYINPLKWGYAGAGAVDQAINGGSKSGSFHGGNIRFRSTPS